MFIQEYVVRFDVSERENSSVGLVCFPVYLWFYVESKTRIRLYLSFMNRSLKFVFILFGEQAVLGFAHCF